MNSLKLWWHSRGHHFYKIPVRLVEKEDWRIEGDPLAAVKSQVQRSLWREEKCELCDATKLKHLKTAEITYGRGDWWK